MSDTVTIPDLQWLQYVRPGGILLSRVEMEKQMLQVWPKAYWIRIKANKIYGLPKKPAFDMEEVVLRHWLLDEMVRRGQIAGDQLGVDVQNYSEESEVRQFTQRLTAMVRSGQALPPKEGIDMSTQQPPNTFMPPGAPTFMPPGVPTFAPPAPPMGMAPPGFAPPGVTQGFAPAQPQPLMPPGHVAGPPVGPPVGMQAGPPTGPPRRGRPPKAEMIGGEQIVQVGVPMPPQGMSVPLPNSAFAPAQVQQIDLGPLMQRIDQQSKEIAELRRVLTMVSMGLTCQLRAQYNKAGSADIEGLLRELNLQVP